MEIIEQINKTREYLDYIEEHVLNVRKAWEVMKEKCADMRFIVDDLFYHTLEHQIEWHDISKLSEYEFVQYRKTFHPTALEGKHKLGAAWEHHKMLNPHHWQNWTANTGCTIHPDDWEIDCAHMICDWMAMGYKFGDTAQAYYEKNKNVIELPEYAVAFIYEIFNRIAE